MRTRLVASISLAVGLFQAVNAWAGSPATLPPFSLPDLEGKAWSDAAFAGKPIIIDFWATWCATCKETVPNLLEIAHKYKDKGLVVVGISVDKGSDSKIKKAAKKLGIDYLVLRDKENALSKDFGFNGIPSLYVFDAMGKAQLALPGYDPDQEKQLDAAVAKAVSGS